MLRKKLIFTLTATAAAATLALGASSALANDYCVGAHPSCPIGVTPTAATATNLQAAVTAATSSPGADTVWVGPGVFSMADLGAPLLAIDSSQLVIRGSGQGQTILQKIGGEAGLVDITGGSGQGSALSDLSIQASGALTDLSPTPVLTLDNVTAQRVSVDVNTGTPPLSVSAVDLTNSSLLDSSVATNSFTAVAASDDDVTVSGTRLTSTAPGAENGLFSYAAATLTYTRNVSVGFHNHLLISGAADELSNSLFDLRDRMDALAIFVSSDGTVSRSVTASDMTIVGSGQDQKALSSRLLDYGPKYPMTVKLKSSIIDLAGPSPTVLTCYRSSSSAGALINGLNNVAADQSPLLYVTSPNSCTNNMADPAFDTASTPVRFVNPAAGDYHLRWDSPFLDTGGTGTSGIDLAGNPRYVTGKAPFTASPASRDPGAYEYQASVPVASFTAAPLTEGSPATFTSTSTDADPGETAQLSYSWNFGDGASATSASVSHTYARNGIYLAKLTATDPAGRTNSTSQTLVVPEPLATVKVTKKPRRAVKRSRSSFKTAKRGQIKLKFNKAAKMRLTIERYNRRASRSKRYKRLKGSQTLSVKSSSVYLAIGGRFNHRRMASGSYRLTITPLAPSGNSGTPVRVSFKLRR